MRVAPLRLRLLAGLVNAAVTIGCLAALVGVVIAAVVAYGRIRPLKTKQEVDQGDEGHEPFEPGAMNREFGPSARLGDALRGASAGLALASRNWRSPGFQLVGLRRVDAQTGGPVAIRSVVIGALFDQSRQAITQRLFGARAQLQRERMSRLGPELTAVSRKHAGDPQAQQRAVIEFYEANDIDPLAGCWWQLAGTVTLELLLALAASGGRTVRDRLTGTCVVVHR